MKMRATSAAALLSITLGGTMAEPPSAHAATAFLDAGAWLSAAGALGGVMLVPFTLHSPVMSDAWGTFTDPSDTVHVPHGPPPPPHGAGTSIYNYGGVYARNTLGMDFPVLGPDEIQIVFHCYPTVFPCLGMETLQATFDRPVLGFGGLFEWRSGYFGESLNPVIVNGFELTRSTFPPDPEGNDALHRGFLGFIGPMETLRIEWLSNNADSFSSLHWITPFAIVAMPVPEPASLAVLGSALLGLLALGATAPRSVRARP